MPWGFARYVVAAILEWQIGVGRAAAAMRADAAAGAWEVRARMSRERRRRRRSRRHDRRESAAMARRSHPAAGDAEYDASGRTMTCHGAPLPHTAVSRGRRRAAAVLDAPVQRAMPWSHTHTHTHRERGQRAAGAPHLRGAHSIYIYQQIAKRCVTRGARARAAVRPARRHAPAAAVPR